MAAAWLKDPTGGHELRYFDGAAWTEHVSDQGATAVDPLPADGPPPPPPEAPASGGGWKDKLKSAATQAGAAGKELADKAKTAAGEQQAKRQEQLTNDPATLWFGSAGGVAAKATGMSKAHYRLTKDTLFVETGLLGVTSERVPLWAICDIDVRQSVLQRGKDVGDVVLHLEDPSYGVDGATMNVRGYSGEGTTSGQVLLDNIDGPHAVRDLLGPLVSEARQRKTVERQSQYIHQVNPAAAAAAAAPTPAGPPVDVADQLRKLASLRDDGILSDEEFAEQKARLLST